MKRLLQAGALVALLVAPCVLAKTAQHTPNYVLRIKPLSRTEVQLSAAKHSFNNACQYVYRLFGQSK